MLPHVHRCAPKCPGIDRRFPWCVRAVCVVCTVCADPVCIGLARAGSGWPLLAFGESYPLGHGLSPSQHQRRGRDPFPALAL